MTEMINLKNIQLETSEMINLNSIKMELSHESIELMNSVDNNNYVMPNG